MSTLLQMEAFCCLCEKKSYTAAANKLNISQSYMSKLIKALEDEYNVQLIGRVDNELVPTIAGQHFYDSCSFIMAEYHRMDHELRLMSMSEKEHLAVGITHNAIMANFYDPLTEFIRKNPNIDVNIIEVQPELFKDFLDVHKIDVAIGWYKDRGTKNYEVFPLISGVWNLCVNKDDPLSKQGYVHWSDLREHEFILSSDDNHRKAMINEIQKRGFSPKVKHYVTFFYNVMELVNRNLGIAPIPSTIGLAGFPNIVLIPLLPELPSNFSMAIRKGEYSGVIREFVDDFTKSCQLKSKEKQG